MEAAASSSNAAAPSLPVPDEILSIRRSIDNIDGALVFMLAERFRLTRRVGVIKAEVALPAVDPERERQQTERLTRLAEEAGLDVAFAEAFRSFVTAEVIRHHHQYAGYEGTSVVSRRAATRGESVEALEQDFAKEGDQQ